MAFIPAGNFMMGPSDQDAVWALNSISKSVTVDAFWMDQTEITNNKYRQLYIMYGILFSGQNLETQVFPTDSILWLIKMETL